MVVGASASARCGPRRNLRVAAHPGKAYCAASANNFAESGGLLQRTSQTALALALAATAATCASRSPGEKLGAATGKADAADAAVMAGAGDPSANFEDAASGPKVPVMAIFPPQIALGEVSYGDKVGADFKICNFGTAPLHIASVALAANSAVKTVNWTLATPFQVAVPQVAGQCDSGVVVHVDVAVTDEPDPVSGQLAALEIQSADLQVASATVPITAQASFAKLFVKPAGFVEFGQVAPGGHAQRTITLTNAGSAPLVVTSVQIAAAATATAPFSLVAGGFGAGASAGAPAIVPPAGSGSFEVQFAPTGAPMPLITGELTIASNAAATPLVTLALAGSSDSSAVCLPVLATELVDFGAAAYGSCRRRKVGIKNVGTAPCAFSKAVMLDCGLSPISALIGSGPTNCVSAQSPYYYAGAADTALFALQPGAIAQLTLWYKAPAGLGMFMSKVKFTPVSSLLIASFEAGAGGPMQSVPAVDPANIAQVGKTQPNVVGYVGMAKVIATPMQASFGPVPVGCKSAPITFALAKQGPAPLWINQIAASPCDGQSATLVLPKLPAAGIELGTEPALFQVQYAPTAGSKLACGVVAYSSVSGKCAGGGPSATDCERNEDCPAGQACLGYQVAVSVSGEATTATDRTDAAVYDGPKTDVLFVIGTSSTMAYKKEAIQDMVAGLATVPLAAGDFHLGVTTADPMAKPAGLLAKCCGVRVVTPKTPNGLMVLGKLADVSVDGVQDDLGLAAAQAALTAPNTTDNGVACDASANCGFSWHCEPDADDPAKKGCGGTNRTFRRPDAKLEVVFVADNDDNSTMTVAQFADWLAGNVAIGSQYPPRAHAIVGPAGGCTGALGGAKAGTRYLEAANASGGVTVSACEPESYQNVLAALGPPASAAKATVLLTATPNPATLQVKVGGVACPAGSWQYDAAHNLVAMGPGGACMPKKGQTVAVHYKLACNP